MNMTQMQTSFGRFRNLIGKIDAEHPVQMEVHEDEDKVLFQDEVLLHKDGENALLYCVDREAFVMVYRTPKGKKVLLTALEDYNVISGWDPLVSSFGIDDGKILREYLEYTSASKEEVQETWEKVKEFTQDGS